MLDYGFRSRCCKAPLRLGKRKKDTIIKSVWVCTKCSKGNVDIIPNDDMHNQGRYKRFIPFSQED